MDRKGFLSVNSSLGEIGKTKKGAALLAGLMSKRPGGEAKIPDNPAMQAMAARQSLKKVLQQGGFSLDEKQLADLNAMLNQIPVS